ncbi:MAG: ATP-dependent DNA helicase [Thermodesulfobacteriota bacterium]
MKEVFEEGGLLSRHLAEYGPRSSQMEMAGAVEELLNSDSELDGKARVLVVEAETGVGKTLAYLVPSLLSGQRVVISTATINLQDQILKKEIPLLEKVYDQDIPAVCIKGRQNYLCHYRWYQYRSSPHLFPEVVPEMDRIGEWLEETETGDRSELAWLSDRSPLWPRISAQSYQCLGGDCPEASLCFVNRLRKRAGSAQLLLVNHHLFFSDLALKMRGYGELLPRYQSVVFDEAHHIENVASGFFGRQFSHYQVLDLLQDVEQQGFAELENSRFDRIKSAIIGLRQRLESFTAMFPARTGRYPLDDISGELLFDERCDNLVTGLQRLAELLEDQEAKGEIWSLFYARAVEILENFNHIISTSVKDESDGFVHWYERRKRTISLSATPIIIADHLRENLYQRVESCVMTSATLTTGGDFRYFNQRMGLDGDTRWMRLNSPFDYKQKTLLYVPGGDFPEPAQPLYPQAICEQVLEILKISRGRALLLFTSFRGLDQMAEYLQERLAYPVLVQGEGSRQALLEQFRISTESVLLGVASFWEGVDVRGESLSCVIVDKLPFEVPSDPVIKARMAGIEQEGGKPFFDFQVPRAILTLRQGLGRLMRSTEDCGLLAVMDVRLFTKGYGRMFRTSLPPSPMTRSFDEIEKFFKNI